MAALLHQMGDLVLKAVDPLHSKKTTVPKRSPAQKRLLWSPRSPAQKRLLWSARTPTSERSQEQSLVQSSELPPNPRYISAHIKTAVFQKSGGHCEYVDPQTKRRCESRSYLQIDHITPVALGGQAVLQNLRVLCASHNNYEVRRMGLARALLRNIACETA